MQDLRYDMLTSFTPWQPAMSQAQMYDIQREHGWEVQEFHQSLGDANMFEPHIVVALPAFGGLAVTCALPTQRNCDYADILGSIYGTVHCAITLTFPWWCGRA